MISKTALILVAVGGVVSLILGFFKIILCSEFWSLYVEVITGTFLALTVIINWKRGARNQSAKSYCLIFGLIGCLACCVLVAILNSVSIGCHNNPTALICRSLNRRLGTLQEHCQKQFVFVQETISYAIGIASFRILTEISLVLLHISLSVVLLFQIYNHRHALWPFCNFQALHIILGLAICLVGSLRYAFCAFQFYLCIELWGGAIIIAIGIYATFSDFELKVIPVIGYSAAILVCLVLTFVNGYGLGCWTAYTVGHYKEYNDYCTYDRETMSGQFHTDCSNNLRMWLYDDWPVRMAEEEIQRIRSAVYMILILLGMAEIIVSIFSIVRYPFEKHFDRHRYTLIR